MRINTHLLPVFLLTQFFALCAFCQVHPDRTVPEQADDLMERFRQTIVHVGSVVPDFAARMLVEQDALGPSGPADAAPDTISSYANTLIESLLYSVRESNFEDVAFFCRSPLVAQHLNSLLPTGNTLAEELFLQCSDLRIAQFFIRSHMHELTRGEQQDEFLEKMLAIAEQNAQAQFLRTRGTTQPELDDLVPDIEDEEEGGANAAAAAAAGAGPDAIPSVGTHHYAVYGVLLAALFAQQTDPS